MKVHQPETRYREQVSSASIGAQNTFSTPVEILGDFNFSLSGTWVGIVFIQRSFDAGTTWLDVANARLTGAEPKAERPSSSDS